ncbi:unnamed protein product [Allacma fusca]|uniref:Uncharacterized protein n=1 Tax=Allacma fusca TaxID=39272 RepID=A0A8J2MFB1_9HEXA|nr:unnamed protein product [Allacma fusca]
MRLLALITILTTTHSWSKVQKLVPKIQSYEYRSAFQDSIQDFTSWVFQILMFSLAALYSAGTIDHSEGSCILQGQSNESRSALPFSKGILQTCRIWAIVNQFFYPQLAIAFLTVYWKLQENYGNYCLVVNLVWICFYAIKTYLFVQEFTLSTLPDEVFRYSLATLQIMVGITHDNIWISIGGVLMIFAFALNPGSVLIRKTHPVPSAERIINQRHSSCTTHDWPNPPRLY